MRGTAYITIWKAESYPSIGAVRQCFAANPASKMRH